MITETVAASRNSFLFFGSILLCSVSSFSSPASAQNADQTCSHLQEEVAEYIFQNLQQNGNSSEYIIVNGEANPVSREIRETGYLQLEPRFAARFLRAFGSYFGDTCLNQAFTERLPNETVAMAREEILVSMERAGVLDRQAANWGIVDFEIPPASDIPCAELEQLIDFVPEGVSALHPINDPFAILFDALWDGRPSSEEEFFLLNRPSVAPKVIITCVQSPDIYVDEAFEISIADLR